MLEYDWDQSVGQWICSTSHALRKFIGAQFSRESITLRQWEVLAWLSKSGGCGSQSELADALGIEPHTLAGVLSRMQRDGLLERKSCDHDRRKNRILPTEKAEALWRRVSVISHGIRNQAVAGISEEELQTLNSLCERIRINLERAEKEETARRGAPPEPNAMVFQSKT
jgi:MarR family transcriptional regulator for hemolysin